MTTHNISYARQFDAASSRTQWRQSRRRQNEQIHDCNNQARTSL